MLNNIYVEGKLVVSVIKIKRVNFLVLEDGSKVPKTGTKIGIKCCECNKLNFISFYHNLDKKLYECFSCRSKGNRNPFYGKKHSEETKNKISEERIGKYTGKDNPFYGKTHSEETRIKISEANKGKQIGEDNPFYGKKHSEELMNQIVESRRKTRANYTQEQKDDLSKIFSDLQRKLKEKDPQKYIEDKRKAGRVSLESHKRFKINSIESAVLDELKKKRNGWKYSVIFCNYQFDFGIKEYKILLEVQGDYWHGNPEIYSELNYIQEAIVNKDKIKAEIAKKHGFYLFYIWEKEIGNKNFSVIDEIEKKIYEIQTNTDSKN